MNYLPKKSVYTAFICSAVLTFSIEASSFSQISSNNFQTPQQQADDCKYDPNDARLLECKKKLKERNDCKYDPNSAKLPCSKNKTKGLLLPAVQAVQTTKEVGRGLNCGASRSITKALKQCGKKRYSYALCDKKNGIWSCIPSRNKTNPKVKPTGFTQTK